MIQQLSAPFHVALGITNKCNLSCKHCIAASSRAAQDLPTRTLLNIIQQLADAKVFSVSIVGGEPLMRKNFFTLIKALSRHRFYLSLNTNATLITKDIAKQLAEYPLRSYTVSLDGSSAAIHERLRGKDSFQKHIAGIRNIVACKGNVLISTIVNRYNYRDVTHISRLAKELGAYGVRFNEIVYTGNAACYRKDLMLTPKQKQETLKTMRQLKAKEGAFVSGSFPKIIEKLDIARILPQATFPLRIHRCGAAVRQCTIRPDGWLIPCTMLWDMPAGNMRTQRFTEIWRSSPVLRAVREEFTVTRDQIPACARCKYLAICYSGNRCHLYYHTHKQLRYNEWHCWSQ